MEIVMVNGTVCGNTIELDSDPGLQDGQQVKVQLLPASMDRWLRSFGQWTGDVSLDESLAEIDRQRHASVMGG